MIKNGLHKLSWVIGIILLAGLSLWAQNDYPQAEVFGGYSYAYIRSTEIFTDRLAGEDTHSNGWMASISGNFHKNFGVTGDFSGHYGNTVVTSHPVSARVGVHNFLVGPRVTARSERWTGFAHALLGVSHTRLGSYFPLCFFSPCPITPSSSRNHFAMAFGGGADVNLSKRAALRAVQLDYLPIIPSRSHWANNVRLGTGVVLKF